jgi:membrane protein
VTGGVKKGLRDEVGLMAGGVAFFAVLGLFPALIAVVALFGLTTDPARTAALGGWLTEVLPATARPLVLEQLHTVVSGGAGSLTTACLIAGGSALWSGSGSAQKLVSSLQSISERSETRGTASLYVLAVGLTLGAAAFVALAVTLLVGTPSMLGELGAASRVLIEAGRWVLLLLLATGGLAVVYRFAPDRRGPCWEWLTPGSVIASIVWLAGSVLFSVYVDHFASYGQTYGVLAGVAVVMLWLYLTAYIVLMGAEINVEAERREAWPGG